ISPKILDIDSDGTDEIIFADQAAGSSGGGYHFGVLSVDNIPDNGDGSETWTFEANGLNDPNLTRSNKWDLAVVDSTLYLFDNNGGISAVQYAGGTYTAGPLDTVSAGWNGSFKGSVTTDLNNDGTDEIIIGSWYSNKVYVLEIGEDTLITYEVAELTDAGRLTGAGGGDLDADGNPDFVFGTRGSPASVPNCALFRVEFQGGDISSPANYTWSIIDSLLVPAPGGTGGELDVVHIANVDGDEADEVIYTQGYSRGVANDTVGAVAVLDMEHTPVSVELADDNIPDEYYLNQNYPNPFNPSTTIKFGITSEMVVELKVFDALGQEVISLIPGQLMKAGSYNVTFNASNLASGTYIYKLKAGSNELSKKMMLIK
ncbi:MAG: T9SS type A sorting domain-containing protein, partial [Ignavibacteria bacterium]